MSQVNINELKKIASIIANEQSQGNNIGKHLQPKVSNSQSGSSHVTPVQASKPIVNTQKITHPETINSSEDVANILSVNSSFDKDKNITRTQVKSDNLCGILGFNISKQTLYLILILLSVAIVIWYMTRDKKSGKKKKKHDDE